ncbi:ParB family chromosome partitioning protein [Labrenzia sp. MBR-25]
MELQHIELSDLKISPLNVRKHGSKSGEDLIPSIKASGLIQPLLVRPNCEGYEIIAGQRRFNALQEIAKESAVDSVPCVVMEKGDDAAAIEASLAENLARLPMDVLDQFDAFHALSKQGQSVAEISLHFGVTEKLVHQRLAIAGLYEPIKNAFRNEEFRADTLQILTMATTRQQKEWYKLFKSEEGYAPQGHRLKSWLFGGEEIPVANALFDLESYKGSIVSDLFGEERYFADPKDFWERQSVAIAEMMEEYREEGWSEVILLDLGERFQSWDFANTPKEEGGKVYISVSSYGEVTAYEGQLSRSELKKREKAESGEEKPERPELTKSMQNYLALHRHAAVRVELLKHQGIALRLCIAQIIACSPTWDVRADRQKANTEAIATSIADSHAQAAFKAQQKRIMALLDIGEDIEEPLVDHRPYYGRSLNLPDIFTKLIGMSDREVFEVLTYVVAETLESGSALVETLGAILKVDMADHWNREDGTFLDLLRDKEAINAMLAEIGGKAVADGNVTGTAKAQKQIISDFITGKGREKNADWQPRYMKFPMESYTERGATRAV